MLDYQVSWFFPDELPTEIAPLIDQYFEGQQHLPEEKVRSLLGLLAEASRHKQLLIRPEVGEKIERAFDEQVLTQLRERVELDFGSIKATLFPYQQEGVKFATFRKAVIIADEMGLGKTIQAIATAVQKKRAFRL